MENTIEPDDSNVVASSSRTRTRAGDDREHSPPNKSPRYGGDAGLEDGELPDEMVGPLTKRHMMSVGDILRLRCRRTWKANPHLRPPTRQDVGNTLWYLGALWDQQNGKCAVTAIPLAWRANEISVNSPFNADVACLGRRELGHRWYRDNVALTCAFVSDLLMWLTTEELVSMAKRVSGYIDFKASLPLSDRRIAPGLWERHETSCDENMPRFSWTETWIHQRFKTKTAMAAKRDPGGVGKPSDYARFLQELFCIQRGRCALTGLPMDLYSILRPTWSISIDRIDGDRGYSRDNVRLTTLWANNLRLNTEDEIFGALWKAVSRQSPSVDCVLSRVGIKNV